MNFLEKAGKRLSTSVSDEMSLGEYLEKARGDKSLYIGPAERLLLAIGEPVKIDTRNDERLGRIFSNRTINTYPAFSDIFGIENTIEKVVSYLKHNAQGLEEKRQILYIKGPVGSAKSTTVRTLKRLFESVPFYAIKGSPVWDDPLSLFTTADSKELGIPERYLNVTPPSGWLTKRITELNGDISKLRVVKLYPSELHQIGISKVEPGDENNQDISALVGKLNIRETLRRDANDPDAYSHSGGLCLGNRGILEFAEMFKAPPKTLHPLLEATQSGSYKGTEALASLPFDGIVIAHSNETEWDKFRNDKANEAMLDRVYLVDAPYCLRYTEERKIYEKMLNSSDLGSAPCAPRTLDTLAKFSVLSRLAPHEGSKLDVKMEVYNGESLKHKNNTAKSVHEYVQAAHESGADEGFFGMSTRFAFKALAQAFNYDSEEVAANPLHLILTLEDRVRSEHLDKEMEDHLIGIIKFLKDDFKKGFDNDVKKAYIENGNELGQNWFDRYVLYADYVLNEDDYRDPNTGISETPREMEKFLEEIELPANISNKKDFRQEVRAFCLKHQAKNNGKNPSWTSYNKIKDVIEAKLFSNMDDMLPIISHANQGTADEKKAHKAFVDRMKKNGYTERQTQVLIDWYVKSNKG